MASELNQKLQVAAAVARVESPDARVIDLLKSDKMRDDLKRAFPTAMQHARFAERFMRLLLTECKQNEKLLQCTPGSFMSCILDMAQLGLEPGPLGHAYLVPFKNTKSGTLECTLILGYKGLMSLARRSGDVASIAAEVVHERDQFDFAFGSSKHLTHRPVLDDEPGRKIAVYAIAQYTNGGFDFRVLSPAQVAHYRSRSRAASAPGDRSPWTTDEEAMWCKTAVRRLAPFMPLTPEAAEAVSLDEERELGLGKNVIEGIDLGPKPTEAKTEKTAGSPGEDTLHQPGNTDATESGPASPGSETASSEQATGAQAEADDPPGDGSLPPESGSPPDEVASGTADRREATPTATPAAPVTDTNGIVETAVLVKLGNTLKPKWKREDFALALKETGNFVGVLNRLIAAHQAQHGENCEHISAAMKDAE